MSAVEYAGEVGGYQDLVEIGPLAARAVRRQLLDAAERLANEFDQLRMDTVIGCFSRAVREVRMAGVATPLVAVEAERLAQVMLNLRIAPRFTSDSC